MLELIPFTGTICGLILFNNIEWKGFVNKLLFYMFWFSLIAAFILGGLNQFIGNFSTIIKILSILNFCSIIVFSVKLNFNRLTILKKICVVLVYLSAFMSILLFFLLM
ncbi:hypothetical protein LHA31_12380 (plasmid) [Carnobacterium viridans]|uniref:Uncharacterized protein n=1 Tax=Carnobacterium viridans TaxID=174587 RepID=A0A1H0XI38_9LACT|nr:hypothetical protein [Carnobacterium viridans]UDE96442.1 hypothetical protein LHA31_12380 [Carnobacterium viridans]SDQ02594.1 hypothetical protein SAMN04487752_0108 [Carnobacterium viridans]